MEDKPIGARPPKEPKNWFGYLFAGIVAAGLSVAIYAGIQYFHQKASTTADKKQGVLDNPAAAEMDPQDVQTLKKTAASFRAVAKMVGPAVVKIKATRGARPRKNRRFQQRPPGGGDPFLDFFERFGYPHPFGPEREDVPQESLGSGFIIDKRGYVITNNHVIANKNKIVVSLWDEAKGKPDRELKAKVIGTDPKTDLAVLKIELEETFPSVDWADSEQVEVGDWAIAIGSPFSLSHTVTVGIVSAKGRSSKVIGADYAELIQTDAAINPGNSGGPLCTLDGKVMGVNTAIYTRSGGYMGIGFAIPSGVAKMVADTLIKEGRVVRGWLGVYIQPIDEDLAKELKIKEGVSVHAVMEDSPAAAAGIEAGDVVIEAEGTAIKDVVQLQRVIAGFKPNQRVKIRVISYKTRKRRTVTVKIGELPDQDSETQTTEPPQEDETPDKLGLIVGKHRKGGVEVKWVESGSDADRVGIKRSDVIIRVNRLDVNSVQQYRDAVSKSTGRISLAVNRKGRALFFRFRPKQ